METTLDKGTRSIHRQVAGAAFILLAATLIGVNIWLFASEYGPLRDAGAGDFVIYVKPIHVLVTWIGICVLGVALGHLLLTRRGAATGGVLAQFAYLSPLGLLFLPLASVLLVMLGCYRWLTPWLYVFVDLRWLFFAAVGTIQIVVIDVRRDGAWRHRVLQHLHRVTDHDRRGRLAIALVMLLTAFAAASSPRQRFHSIIVGDEPKYLRFLENWYRGQGLDISHFPPLDELPDDRPRLLDNLRHLGSATRTIARALVADVGRMSQRANVSFEQRIEATAAGNWSVRGVHGGLYQGHHPGASLFLLPGYVLDRYLLNWTNIHQRDLPTYLYATNASLFVLFALWAVALYYLVAAHSGNDWLAFALVAVVMMSLPTTAFNYQYYAETAGGFVITLVACFAMFMTASGNLMALTCGLLAGFLPLMHPRWGPAAMIVAVTVAATRRHRTRPQLLCFFAGFVAMMATFVFYTYYITGSLLPWTMYEIDPTTPGFSAARAAAGLPQLWLNWRWGIAAHAPVYWLALPGLVVFARRRPSTAITTLAIVLATATLAAAHGWGGSGTTPGRLIAAVMPLMALPMADAYRAYGRSRWFVAIVVLLSVLSVSNGFLYNVFFERSDVAFNAPSMSGWNTTLLFARPDEGAHVDAMLIGWTLVSIGLIAWPLLSRIGSERARRLSWAATAGVVLVVFTATGSVVAAYSGNVVGYRFLNAQDTVEQALARAYLEEPTGYAWSAQQGRIDLARFVPNAVASDVAFRATGADDPRNVDFVIDVTPSATASRPVAPWGSAAIDFGDGTSLKELPVIGRVTTRHRYAAGRQYTATLTFITPGSTAIRSSRLIMIPAEPPHDLPGWAHDYALGIDVHDVLVEGPTVRVRCGVPSDLTHAREAPWWAWVGTSGNQSRGGAVVTARQLAEAGAGSTIEFTVWPAPAPGERVVFSVGVTATRANGGTFATRSRAATIIWPDEQLTRGGAVAASMSDPFRP